MVSERSLMLTRGIALGGRAVYRNSSQENPNRTEETQRFFRPVEFQDGAENAKAGAPGVELAERALRPGVIRRFDLGDRQRQLQRVDAELGFDLEAVGQHRK